MSLLQASQEVDSSFDNIPVIDLKDIGNKDQATRQRLVQEVRDACMQVGFFYVKNHGISDEVVQAAYLASKELFALPEDIKMEIEYKKTPNHMGYSPLLSSNNDPQNAGDLMEGFEFGYEPTEKKGGGVDGVRDDGITVANIWPANSPGFRETVLQYYHAALGVGELLFPLFALALDLPENFFEDKTRHSAALMKLLHYPPQVGEVDERIMGIGAHTDWECFTILWQEPEIQALQVLNNDKEWIKAPPLPGTLVINLGDQLARWTNDVFKSTVHRAVNRSGMHRYSIPVFVGTDYNVPLEPIASCVSGDRPPKYEVITAGDYVKSRFKAAYGQ
ncbi:Clavaminate synthase-like protein [Athelia psychrophila]|uniref:Clavaminate synthase-like protein n=1 Tax=Athelia psychrophila TaxID=1759441 RepID=A0A166CR49_9AGAM|nr:Clavaminate synthase-like protein [Fibularhizoctonia sp. CBS 109695]